MPLVYRARSWRYRVTTTCSWVGEHSASAIVWYLKAKCHSEKRSKAMDSPMENATEHINIIPHLEFEKCSCQLTLTVVLES